MVKDLLKEMLSMDKDLHQETMEIDPIMEDLAKRQTQGIRTKEGAALIQSKAPNRVAMTNGRVAITNGQEKTFRSIWFARKQKRLSSHLFLMLFLGERGKLQQYMQ
jgi:hypothetical protein